MGELCQGGDERWRSTGTTPTRPTPLRPGQTASRADDAPELAGAEQGHPADAPAAREQQIGEHVRYREIVEASYQSAEARDAWAEAAPALRAEWEAHKQRYPDREQQPGTTLADGSWIGDGNRRLSPEQNAEAAKCAADLRDEAIQRIGPAMDRVAAADPDRRLAGREHMLKGEDRLKEKIADELSAKPTAYGESMRSIRSPTASDSRWNIRPNATLRASLPTSTGSRRRASS